MTDLLPYQYCVLRYAHDPAAGECLNVGVVLYAPDQGLLRYKLNSRYRRLSDAFAGFDPDAYRKAVGVFESVMAGRQRQLAWEGAPESLPLFDPPRDVREIALGVWPDPDLSYQVGPAMGGVTDAFEEEIDALYYRFVESQFDGQRRSKRDDKDVWTVYLEALRREEISTVFAPKVFTLEEFEYSFEHAYRAADGWHVLQPVSMDYAERFGIRDRVERLLGESQVLDNAQVGCRLYLLLGSPTDPSHHAAYRTAKRQLGTMRLKHEIYEEDESDALAQALKRVVEGSRPRE